MAEFTITDAKTGKSLTVVGDVPPTPADIDALFAQQAQRANVPAAPAMPPPSASPSVGALANEVVAGAARNIAGMGDIITSPFQALMLSLGKPVPSLESMVTPRGAFAGRGTAGEAAASVGEMSVAGLSAATGFRSAVTTLLDDASRYGESAFRGVLRQLGSSTPVDDTLAAVSGAIGSAGGKAAGEAVAGPTGGRVGEAVGGMFSPAALVPAIRRATRQLEPLVREAAPSTQELRGASSALYKQIEDMGIVFSESATQRVAKELEGIATKEGLTDLRGESALAGQYRKARDMLTAKGPYTGTTFGVMDKIRASFNDIAKGTDNEARIARRLAEAVDNKLMSPDADVDPTADFSNLLGDGSPFTPELKRSVAPTLSTARALWRRAKTGELVEDAIKDAQVASMGRGGQEYETALLNNFRNLLRNPSSDTPLSESEKKLIADAIKGGGIRRTLEVLQKFGVKSDDYVKTMVMGTVAGSIASGASVTPSVLGGVAAAVSAKALSEVAGAIASRMLRTDANTLSAMIKAGPNAQAIARIYMSKVPAEMRSATELSALFKASGADLSKLEKLPMYKSPLISDAVALTTAWNNISDEQE